MTLWQEERGERREIELYTCFISLPFISINDFLLGLYNRDLKKKLGKEIGRSQISIVRAHRLRFIQPWLLQHNAGTPGFRIERMLTKLVTEKFTDHRGIDWAEIASQH